MIIFLLRLQDIMVLALQTRIKLHSISIQGTNYRKKSKYSKGQLQQQQFILRCFDTVLLRPYRYISIALEVVFSSFDHYKIFTSNWLWIEIRENVVLSKIDVTMTTINKKL